MSDDVPGPPPSSYGWLITVMAVILLAIGLAVLWSQRSQFFFSTGG